MEPGVFYSKKTIKFFFLILIILAVVQMPWNYLSDGASSWGLPFPFYGAVTSPGIPSYFSFQLLIVDILFWYLLALSISIIRTKDRKNKRDLKLLSLSISLVLILFLTPIILSDYFKLHWVYEHGYKGIEITDFFCVNGQATVTMRYYGNVQIDLFDEIGIYKYGTSSPINVTWFDIEGKPITKLEPENFAKFVTSCPIGTVCRYDIICFGRHFPPSVQC